MEKIDSTSSIEIYRSPEGNIELNVKLENDTVWLTQSQMAELFGRDRTVISRHIRNCFNEGELDKSLVCAKFAHPKKYGRREGFVQTVEKEYYNLDVIISVGYRVKSINGTRFRQWANTIPSIIMDEAKIRSVPEIAANDLDAQLIHEAAIGRIAGDQLLKLETLGLTEEEAEDCILKGFLS